MDPDTIGQILIIYSSYILYEKKWEHNEAVHQLFIDFKKAYDSFKREALYNISLSLVSPETGKANKNV